MEPWEDFILVYPAQVLEDSLSEILLDWEDPLCMEWPPSLSLESVDDILGVEDMRKALNFLILAAHNLFSRDLI